MKKMILAVLILSFSLIRNLSAEPQLDGRFFGGGDNNEYLPLGNADGDNGTIYYFLTDQNLYLAVVVNTSINDNVFAKNGKNKQYLESVYWPQGKHEADDLINDTYTDNCHLEMKIDNGTQIWNWRQALLTNSGDNWISNIYYGSAPPNTETKSSTSWNINESSWIFTTDGTAISRWKSPQITSGNQPPGYPIYDTVTDWEWPIVYEMKIPIASLGAETFSIEVVSVYNNPAKNYTTDFTIPEVEFLDYGDAPDSYKTLASSGGASHKVLAGGIYLGSQVDVESDGCPDSSCDGDDSIDGNDDEDGVLFLNSWIPGNVGNLEVTASGIGNLSAWADFDQNGIWDDPGEKIFADQILSSGVNNLQVSVPADAALGLVNTRFRFSTESSLTFDGAATDGEVEDYQIELIEKLGSIGNYVWHDFTQDGIQDLFEGGQGEVTVNLYDYNYGSPSLEATVQTSTEGFYQFTDLEPGDYFLEFLKSNMDFSLWNVGDDTSDSDANPADGRTEVYTLAAGEDNHTVDCGLYSSDPLPVTLSSFEAGLIVDRVQLLWTTQSESNNALWNIYRGVSQNAGQSVEVNYESIPGAGTTSEPTNYYFYDYTLSELIEEQDLINPTIFYWLESIDNCGTSELHGPVSVTVLNSEECDFTPEIPDFYGLNQNYPNPFNPTTEISFNLAKACNVSLQIYNVKGERVKTVCQDKECDKNRTYTEHWNGKDSRGNTVSSGIYLAVLKTKDEIFTRKMILQK